MRILENAKILLDLHYFEMAPFIRRYFLEQGDSCLPAEMQK